MPGLVRFKTLRDSISKYRTSRLASSTSLLAASLAIPTRPGAGESPNSIFPNIRLLFAHVKLDDGASDRFITPGHHRVIAPCAQPDRGSGSGGGEDNPRPTRDAHIGRGRR